MTQASLRDFILEEMKRRKMSMRQFADFMGMSHPTLSRTLAEVDPVPPSLEFLVKLAKATKTDIRTIVAMVAPDAVIEPSSEVLMLAERLSRLTEDQRRLIDATIAGFIFKGGNRSEK